MVLASRINATRETARRWETIAPGEVRETKEEKGMSENTWRSARSVLNVKSALYVKIYVNSLII